MASAHGFMVNNSFGSLTAISDASGNLVESLSYDPWDRRRNPNNWNDYNVTSTLFDRGFTGHACPEQSRREHLPQFGLINMNGRVYDPFLARFLSPDPYVQSPGNLQNYNRYSYALNNPLKYTDPSGYTYKPDDWNKGMNGAISYNSFHSGYQGQIGPGSGNHWSDPFMAGSQGYYYDWGSGQYIDYFNGSSVSYSTVSNNFIAPHSYSSLRSYNSSDGARFYTISMAGKTGVFSTFGTISGIFANADGAIKVVAPGAGTHGFLEDNPNSYWELVFGISFPSGQGGMPGWASDVNTGINAFGVANSAKTELIDYAVRSNYKSARTWSEFNNLRSSQQAWRTTNTLGKTGASYLKYAKGLGYVGAGLTTAYSVSSAYNYYNNGGSDWSVYAKSGIDVIMTGVGFLGPIGFGVSATYFILDATTGGFGGFGQIKP